VTTPVGWHPDPSPRPNNAAACEQKDDEPRDEAVQNAQPADVMDEPTGLPWRHLQRVGDDVRPYTWVVPASEIASINWLSKGPRLDAELSYGELNAARYSQSSRWVGHVSVCVALLAILAGGIELVARARSEPAERSAYRPRGKQGSAVDAARDQPQSASATPTVFPHVAPELPPSAAGIHEAPRTPAAGGVEPRPAQDTPLRRSPAAPPRDISKPAPPTATPPVAPPPSAATTRVAAAQTSSAERVVPKQANTAQPTTTPRAAPVSTGSAADVELRRHSKALDSMDLL
jgi:hypothetical protein